MRNKLPNVNGAASAMAQGQAIIKTAVNTLSAFEASKNNQKIVDVNAIVSTQMVKFLLILSVNVLNDDDLSFAKTSLLHNWVK